MSIATFPDFEFLSEAHVKVSLITTLGFFVKAEGCDLCGAGIDG
jgi:hypothetical protein